MNCRIRTGGVLGLALARVDDPCAPTFGDNADMGAGANVLGRITIVDNMAIRANSVVTRSVPSNSMAVGIPAWVKIRRRLRVLAGPMQHGVFAEAVTGRHLGFEPVEIDSPAKRPSTEAVRD